MFLVQVRRQTVVFSVRRLHANLIKITVRVDRDFLGKDALNNIGKYTLAFLEAGHAFDTLKNKQVKVYFQDMSETTIIFL